MLACPSSFGAGYLWRACFHQDWGRSRRWFNFVRNAGLPVTGVALEAQPYHPSRRVLHFVQGEQVQACRHCRHSGMQACRRAGAQACRHAGVQARGRAGVQACRHAGVRAARARRRQAQACKAAFSWMPRPLRASTSTAPVTELRRNNRPGTPESSTAFTVRGASPSTVSFVPAVR